MIISGASATSSGLVGKNDYSFLSERIDAIAYYLAFAFYCINEAIGRTAFNQVLFFDAEVLGKLLTTLSLVLLVIKLLSQVYTRRQMLIVSTIAIIAFCSWRITGENLVLWTTIFILAGQNVKIRSLAWIALAVYSVTFSLTVICSVTGDVKNILYSRGSSLSARTSMGFNHPNSYGKVLLEVNLAYLILRFNKIKLYDYLLPMLSIVTMIYVVDTRTSALSLLIAIMVLAFFKLKRLEKRFGLISAISLILLILTSLYFMQNYMPSIRWEAALNSLLSGRLWLANHYYSGWPPSLLGTSFANAPLQLRENLDPIRFNVDNTYCHVLLQYGYAIFVLLMVGVLLVFVKAQKEGKMRAITYGLFVFALLAFSETWAIRFDANYFLVALSSVIYSRDLRTFDPTISNLSR